MVLFIQQLINGVAAGAGYALFAIGFGLMFSILGVLNVAHGTYATWGALLALWAVESMGVPFLIAALMALVGVGLLGVVVDLVAFNPLRRTTGGTLAPMITSIGVWIILRSLALETTNADRFRFPPVGSFPTVTYKVGPFFIPFSQIVVIGVAIVVLILVDLLIRRTRPGSAMRAVGWRPQAAAISGVNVRWVLMLTTFVAACVAGASGILTAMNTSSVSFALGENLLFKGFAAVVIGGFGDVRGMALGALLIGLSETFTSQYVSSVFRDAVTFGLAFALLMMRPGGLLAGRWQGGR